jgi:hypothetical protein
MLPSSSADRFQFGVVAVHHHTPTPQYLPYGLTRATIYFITLAIST